MYRQPGLPDDIESRFDGPADPLRESRPDAVYPLDRSVHPPSFARMQLQWRRGSARSVYFRHRFENETGAFDVYAGCSEDECSFSPPETVWSAIASPNRGRAVQWIIGATGRDGTDVAWAGPYEIGFLPEGVHGSVYYWSPSIPATAAIRRAILDTMQVADFIRPSTVENPGTCAGCHSISADGRRLAFTSGGFLIVSELADPTVQHVKLGEGRHATTVALDPTGGMAAVGYAQDLHVLDVASGRVLAKVSGFGAARNLPAGWRADHPEWSPDGSAIAFTLIDPTEPSAPADASVRFGGIAVAEMGDALRRGAPSPEPTLRLPGAPREVRTLVPLDAAAQHVYPTWSPDSRWIAFTSMPRGRDSAHTQAARLRLVGRDGGPAYHLARASPDPTRGPKWARFAPVTQRGGRVLIVLFHSTADYGWQMRGDNDNRAQIWMTTVDLDALPADPSTAPVWLPFQDLASDGYRPIWVAPPTPCAATARCD